MTIKWYERFLTREPGSKEFHSHDGVVARFCICLDGMEVVYRLVVYITIISDGIVLLRPT